MGALARMFGGAEPPRENPLGLLTGADMPNDMARQCQEERYRYLLRGAIVDTQTDVIERVAYVTQVRMARISRNGELAASVVPEERQRVDAITDTATVLLQQAMAKLADP